MFIAEPVPFLWYPASPYLFNYTLSFGFFWFTNYLSYLLRQWEKTEYQQLNKDGKHQVEHFDDFSSRKVCKVKNLLTVLNCQVIKAKSKWSKLSFFWAKRWKTQKDEQHEKSKNRKKKKKHQSSQARRFMFEKSKKTKIQKVEKSKSRTLLIFREKFHLKGRKVRKSRPFWLFGFLRKNHPKSRKKNESRKLFDFLTVCEKFCNFRAVRLPARGALSNFLQYLTC